MVPRGLQSTMEIALWLRPQISESRTVSLLSISSCRRRSTRSSLVALDPPCLQMVPPEAACSRNTFLNVLNSSI